MKVKLLNLLLVVSMLLLLVPIAMAQEGEVVPNEEYKIAFVDCLNTTVFWLSMEEAMKARAEELGVDLTVVAPSKPDVTEQTALIEDLLAKGINGLILGTCDSKGIIPAVEKANAAGVPVIAVDTAIDGGDIASLIQTNNIKGAEMAAEYIAQDLGGKGKVLVIDGNLVHQTGRDRARVGSYLEENYPDIEIIQQPGDWTQEKALAVAENVLTANPDVNWIFNAADPMAMGAIQAVEAQGLTGQIKIMGFDANPESIEAMKKGTMHAEIAQYPKDMGALGLEFVVRLLNGEEIPENYDTGTGLITRDDVLLETLTPAEELAPADDYKIAFVDCLNTTVFWLSMEEAMKARAEELGVDLTVVAPSKPDVTEQTALIEDLIAKGIDGLVLGTCDSKGIIPAVEKANEAGIPVIAVDTAIDGGDIASLIQTNNIKGAEMAAEYIAQDLGGKGKVLVIDGNLVHQTGRDRARVGSYLEENYPDITVIQQPGDWTQEKALAVAENVLTANPDVNWIFNAADPMAMGAIQAVEAQGLTGQIKIMGFDANPESIEAMKKGTMHAEIAQYPKDMGALGLDFTVRILNGEEIPGKYDTGTGLITPEDLE